MKTALKPYSGRARPEEEDVVKQQGVARMPSLVRNEQDKTRLETRSEEDSESENRSAPDDADAPPVQREAAEETDRIGPTSKNWGAMPLHISDELFERAIRAAGKVLARS